MPRTALAPRSCDRCHRVGSTHRQSSAPRAAIVALGLLASLASAPASLAGGGCVRGAVNCANNTAETMRTCSATLQCIGGIVNWQISTTSALNVTACEPGTAIGGISTTFTLVARANVASPTNRACGWFFGQPLRTASGGVERGPVTGTVSITTADGLPVELMGFSVEGDFEPAPDDGSADPEPDSD